MIQFIDIIYDIHVVLSVLSTLIIGLSWSPELNNGEYHCLHLLRNFTTSFLFIHGPSKHLDHPNIGTLRSEANPIKLYKLYIEGDSKDLS